MPALVTPFDKSGAVDLDAHQTNVAEMARRGITGFLIGGSTGQGPYLEPDERRELTSRTRDVSRTAFIMTGVGAETVRSAIAQTEEAAAGAADAVLVLTPTTLVRNRDALIEGFFTEVADRSPLPVFLYSVPGVTASALPVGIVAALSGHPNVVGMKDSGGDPVRAADIVGSTPEDFMLYGGASRAIALTIAAGARGAITASTNYAPALVGRVVGARSTISAADPQASLTAVTRVVEPHGIPGTNAAAMLTGLDVGVPRRPLRPVSAATVRAIGAALEAQGIETA